MSILRAQGGQFAFQLAGGRGSDRAVHAFPGVEMTFPDTQLSADLPGRLAAIEPQPDGFPFEGGIIFSSRFDRIGLIGLGFFHSTDCSIFSLNCCPSNRSNLTVPSVVNADSLFFFALPSVKNRLARL